MSYGLKVVDRLLLVLLTVGVIDLEVPETLPESMFCCIEGVSWVSLMTTGRGFSWVLGRVAILGSVISV